MQNYGVSHADELFLLFRWQQVSSSWLGDLALQTEDDLAAGRRLVQAWARFVTTGSPAPGQRQPLEIPLVSLHNCTQPMSDMHSATSLHFDIYLIDTSLRLRKLLD